MASRRRHAPYALALTCSLLAATASFAQQPDPEDLEEVPAEPKPKRKPNPLEEVDPGSTTERTAAPDPEPVRPAPKKAAPTPPAPKPEPSAVETPKKAPPTTQVDEMLVPVKPKPVSSKPLPVAPAQVKTSASAPAVDPSRAPPKPMRVDQASNDVLLHEWSRFKKAAASSNAQGQAEAMRSLLKLRTDLSISDLEQFSMGLIRQADARAAAGDSAGAVLLADGAAQLSPHLPAAHFALAEAYFRDGMFAVTDWLPELKNGVSELWTDPRYSRPSLGDAGTGALFALLGTAVAAVVMLFARRVRYFLHDFHHLFPRAAAKWQSAAMATLILSLPVVFRLGVAPLLLVLFAVVCVYLSTVERLVGAVLLACLGAVPFLAGQLTAATAFAGTVADDVYALERNGLDAEPAAERLGRRVSEGKAEFAELFALGRYDLRRGNVETALDRFKLAASKRPTDARLLTNVGNAMFAREDLEGAADMYKAAAQADSTLAAPNFNVSKLHGRRAKVLRTDLVGDELDKAQVTKSRALQLEPVLAKRIEPTDDDLSLNNFLLSPELPMREVLPLASSGGQEDKVVEQLSSTLLGRQGPLALAYPAVVALLLFGLGFVSRSGATARACEQCGRSVCRRCDPELPHDSTMCGQCVNVFVKRNAVSSPVKVRKQLEVDQYQTRMGRLSYVFGLLCAGAGHFFGGLPIRGALYNLAFLFAAFSVFYRQGVLRPAYGSVPVLIRLIPLGLVFAAVYLLSMRGLYKKHEES